MYNQWTSQRHQRMTQTQSALESMNIPKSLIQSLDVMILGGESLEKRWKTDEHRRESMIY